MNSKQLNGITGFSLKHIIIITYLTLAISGSVVVDKGYLALPNAASPALSTTIPQVAPKKISKNIPIFKSNNWSDFHSSLDGGPENSDASFVNQQSFRTDIASGNSFLNGFRSFLGSLGNGQADTPQGVFVQDVLQLPIVQQPIQNPVFVSNKPGVVTQYRDAARNGIIGLLAHNYLSGELFDQLAIGQEVLIVYGDRTVRHYQVESIHQFQKLNPSNMQSDYLDLSDDKKMSSYQVFNEFYQGNEHVTFQTCLKEDGHWNWGLVFIVANPLEYKEQ